MAPPTPLSFTHQDLRRQRFRGRSLQNAAFRHCDLRGCNFFQADLQGAQFDHCWMGSSYKWAIALLSILPMAMLLFHAVSSLVFASMGTLPGDPAWPYVRVLTSVLAIATVSAGLQAGVGALPQAARLILGVAMAALMGFFYVGSWTDNNATFAIGGAILLGLLGGLFSWRWRSHGTDAALSLLGAIPTYGYAFWTWTTGSSLFTTGSWLVGLGWAAIALLAVGITLRSLGYGVRSLRRFSRTSFRQANLTDCSFVATDMTHCDFTDAIR